MDTEDKKIEDIQAEAENQAIDTSEDIQKLMVTLQKERAAREQYEKQLKEAAKREQEQKKALDKYKAIDPDKYQALLEEAARKEEQELEQKRAYEELKQRYKSGEEAAIRERDEMRQKYEITVIENAIRNAFFENGGRKPAILESSEGGSFEDIPPVEVIINQLRARMKIVDGRVCIVDRVGSVEHTENGRPKTLSEKMQELRKGSLGTLFEPVNDSKGGGMSPQTASIGGKQVKVYTRKQAMAGQVPMAEIASGAAVIQG